jgi:hypothetical protein
MSQVFTTTYEVIGAGIPIAEAWQEEVANARREQMEMAEEMGGCGIRPDHNGGVRSVFFEELPHGWRRIGADRDKIEAVPRKGTKAGEYLTAALASLPEAPNPSKLARRLGYDPTEMAIDSKRGTIHFPSELTVVHPTRRIFLRLPRFEGDGFTPDETLLRAIPESQLMKAVEDHNAEAKRLREGAEA